MEDEKTEAPEQSEAFKKGMQSKEHVDAILEHTEWLRKNAPSLHFIFVATPGRGQIIFSPGGSEYLIQLGILDIARGLVETPVVMQIEERHKPKEEPSSLVSPHGMPIPMTHSQR
jgi:hypothetical protein